MILGYAIYMHECRTGSLIHAQNGITYIAQVLKRNRTLKVLNLSANRIDVTGLAALADALVGNFAVLLCSQKVESLLSG